MISLLYPLEYNYHFTPLITERILFNLQVTGTFICGINTNLFNLIKGKFEINEDVFIYNLEEKKFYYHDKKGEKFENIIKRKNLNFPDYIEKLLTKYLNKIYMKNKQLKPGYDTFNSNLKIRHLFIYIFSSLLKNYKKFKIISGKDIKKNLFDKEGFLNESKKNKEFNKYLINKSFALNIIYNNKEIFFDNYIDKYLETKEKKSNDMDALKDLYENYFKKEYLKFFDVGKNLFNKTIFH